MSQGFHPERDPSDLKNVKTVEENGEEAEPVRNGAESISEGEGIDANSGSTDSSGEGVTFHLSQVSLSLSSCVCFLFSSSLYCNLEKCCLLLKKYWMEGRGSSQCNIYRINQQAYLTDWQIQRVLCWRK